MRKFFCCIVVVLMSLTFQVAGADNVLLGGINDRLAVLKRDAGSFGFRVKYESDVMFDCEVVYGSPIQGKPATIFLPIVEIMSNNWHEVMLNIGDYTTNVIDRVLLENTATFLGEEAYLGYLSILADKVIAQEIPLEELECLRMNAWHNHAVSSVLYRRYQDPAVSNLVLKLQSAGVGTNTCHRILSGEANAHYSTLLEKGHLD